MSRGVTSTTPSGSDNTFCSVACSPSALAVAITLVMPTAWPRRRYPQLLELRVSCAMEPNRPGSPLKFSAT
jgi:hypothetical protein